MQITRLETYNIIWNQLQNSKFKELQLALLLEKFQKREKTLNIFLVIATSSSISAWAIWQLDYLKWLWAGIIALSQIVILVKPYLNYVKYAKELNEKHFLLETLNVEYEKLWLAFKFQKISIQEAFDKSFELKTTMSKSLNFSDDVLVTKSKKIADQAKADLLNYLKVTFNYNP
ncbi:MAG: hypothetical protein JKY70_15395 [Mucilaginibacter sp.]|nr:hypothetical protein [Mucilaginibacter sp.]